MNSCPKRLERIKEFEHKLKSSLFSVSRGVINPGCIYASVLFALIEILVQKVVYAVLTPTSFSPLYVFSNLTVPLAVAMLFGAVPAFIAGLISSLLIAVFTKCSLWVFITAATAPAIAALTAPKITSRKMLATVFSVAFIFQAIFAMVALYQCFGLELLDHKIEITAQLLAFAAFFAFSSLVFPFAYLPLAEKISNIPSNITISKFLDLEHPLLNRLSLDAPGTYHHSVSVGDLAKDAADAIGANSLIARVGAYYHDVGKLTCPHYYMENQTGTANPHDNFPPNISRLIIMNHVRDGYCLAKSQKIPWPILRIIETHHGTSVISWFYRKALQEITDSTANKAYHSETDDNNDLKTGIAKFTAKSAPEYHYRYDGPLPRTREETIVSLADSIEAASRSLVSPTEETLAKLVDNIVKLKSEDGQLDESELTEAEIVKIKTAFKISLKHLLHVRLPYPPKNDTDKH